MAKWTTITKPLPTKRMAESMKNIANPHKNPRKIVKLKAGYVVKSYH